MTTTTHTMLNAAHDLHTAGMCVVPVRQDGTKRPDVTSWTRYQKERTTPEQHTQWFTNHHKTGIGVIYGHISGNVEMIEFEGRAIQEGVLDEITEVMNASGLDQAWDTISTGWVTQSPSGGLHFRLRVHGGPVPGNTKLASREAREDELTAEERAKKERNPRTAITRTLIETRGEGGFGIVDPSHGSVHDTGLPYVRIAGGPDTIPTISAETAQAVRTVLRMADRMPQRQTPAQAPARARADTSGAVRPGDDYNQRTDWRELLEPAGWRILVQRGTYRVWQRPGKTGLGGSATTGRNDADRLFVFTTSTEFTSEKAYSKFDAYTLLHHGGNYRAAAKELGRAGYGEQRPAKPVVAAADVDWSDIEPPPPTNVEPPHVDEETPTADEPDTLKLPSPDNPMKVARALLPEWTHHGTPTLRHWRGAWMQWTGPHWHEVEVAKVRSDLYLRTEHAIYPKLNPKTGEHTDTPWAPNRTKIANLLEASASIVILPETVNTPAYLNGQPGNPGNIVACRNGLLNIRTRQLNPLTPTFFNIVSSPIDYNPKAPEPKHWLTFLDTLWPNDPEAITLLQQWCGYVLSGRTDLQKALLLVGAPRSGKGTIARIITQLVGAAHVASPTLAGMGTNFGLSALIGKPLAIIPDARMPKQGTEIVVERILSITGEDAMDIDRKYKDAWTGRLPSRLMILSNDLPAMADASGAVASRLAILTLTQSFLGREDYGLEGRLMGELPGILTWALDGLVSLGEAGRFKMPASSQTAVHILAEATSPIHAWLDDQCQVGPEHTVGKEALYADWEGWCLSTKREHPGTMQTFSRRLFSAVPAVREVKARQADGSRKRMWAGIRVV